MGAVNNGLGVPESLLVFSLSASDCSSSGQNTAVLVKGLLKEVESQGNVFTIKATALDMALWKIGGEKTAVALRLTVHSESVLFKCSSTPCTIGWRLLSMVLRATRSGKVSRQRTRAVTHGQVQATRPASVPFCVIAK